MQQKSSIYVWNLGHTETCLKMFAQQKHQQELWNVICIKTLYDASYNMHVERLTSRIILFLWKEISSIWIALQMNQTTVIFNLADKRSVENSV